MILPQIGTQLTLGFISLHTLGVIEMILLKFSKNLIVSEAGRKYYRWLWRGMEDGEACFNNTCNHICPVDSKFLIFEREKVCLSF